MKWIMLFFALVWLSPGHGANDALLLENGTRDFLRYVQDDNRPAALQTAIIRFEGDGPGAPVVDLVSAVHVADAAYFQSLNSQFRQYDAVLYELVADPDSSEPQARPGAMGLGLVSSMQGGMTQFLALSHQLEQVDYSAANFVHADLTPKQFSEAMTKRGESFLTLLLRVWFTALTTPGMAQPMSDADLFSALIASDRTQAFKVLLARQFADMDQMMAAMSGGDGGSALIHDRNTRALQVLREQLAAGHRRIAIFYGAGHMVDFSARLMREFDLVPVSQRWLDAWNLRPDTPNGEG